MNALKAAEKSKKTVNQLLCLKIILKPRGGI